jgi:membrane-associated protease RseP (regulator of RpoE activity)
LKTSSGNYNLSLGEHPQIKGFPYIGISSMVNARYPTMFLFIFPLLGMIASLSIFVGIFNILPLYPLDGGLMVEALAEKYAKKRSKKIVKAISCLIIIILIYGVIGPYL